VSSYLPGRDPNAVAGSRNILTWAGKQLRARPRGQQGPIAMLTEEQLRRKKRQPRNAKKTRGNTVFRRDAERSPGLHPGLSTPDPGDVVLLSRIRRWPSRCPCSTRRERTGRLDGAAQGLTFFQPRRGPTGARGASDAEEFEPSFTLRNVPPLTRTKGSKVARARPKASRLRENSP
jgi:hypothetical protein